ncbi:ABC transporter permease subunit/CPBP intramembrane protease [Niameybacter massiliensis]|uniref:ABC transporter permease subunit/CPBP intramembrane protease n=1 Tax=Niameybacter massiliensis TaxID=1658108 RepID=UPI0006B58689|nr:ABC transporter permease subunit/CPBP intramembrane protease [Niameybacter massiliensis]
MRSYIIKNILKKELKDIFRDKKTIFMMIVLPILLYPAIMLITSQITMYSMNKTETASYKVSVSKGKLHNQIIEKLLQEEDYEHLEFIEVGNPGEALEQREIDAYIEVEVLPTQQMSYKIYINSSIGQSQNAGHKLQNFLEEYKEQMIYSNIEQIGLDPIILLEPVVYDTVDLAKNEQKAGQLMAMILPLILIIGILMGALYPAIDVMAGEKERGTIETLLTLPVSNLELIIGKFLAVAIISIISAVLNVISIVASIMLVMISADLSGMMSQLNIDAKRFIVPFLIAFICILIFALIVSAISMCVCSMAKSFKEAQNYATPLMLVLMLPGYASMIPGLELTTATACIPIVNVVLLIKSVLTFQYNIGAMAIVIVTNFGFLILSLIILAKMFNSEEILFGSSKEFSILQKRYNIQKGTLPTPSDSLMIYVIALLGIIYIGSLLQVKLGFLGLALTQALVIAIPILFGWYIKTDFKEALSLKKPKGKHIGGAIILWGGLFFLVQGISLLMMLVSPDLQELNNKLAQAVTHPNLFVNLLVVAALPAICEEVLFRGMIYKGLEDDGKHVKWAIIVSGVLFGIMHLDFFRMIPTAILGIGFAYIVYSSKSIFLAMMVHFLNNGVIVLVQHFIVRPDVEPALTSGQIIQSSVVYLLLSVLPLVTGMLLLGYKDQPSIKKI